MLDFEAYSTEAECAVLEAVLAVETVQIEREHGTDISIWGVPEYPNPRDGWHWNCELPEPYRWELLSTDIYGADHRTPVISAEQPVIDGSAATVNIIHYQWEPDAEVGWVSKYRYLLSFDEARWAVTASELLRFAD